MYDKKYKKSKNFENVSQILIIELITCHQFEQKIHDFLQILIESYEFLDLLPILRGCNFFSTQPILKISDAFSTSGSNSFISAVLVAQSKIGVPSHGYLWARISKILKKSMCTTPVIVTGSSVWVPNMMGLSKISAKIKN